MSDNSFMRTRSAGNFAPRLGDQGRRRQEANKRSGGGGKIAPGMFDRFWATEIPIWINISPYSMYEQEVYDKQQKEVIKTETTWYEWQKHYIPRNKGRVDNNGKRIDTDFVCAAGPYLKVPCWGCSIRQNHFDVLDRIEAEKGIRPDTSSPINRIPQFTLAVSIMEKIYAIPQRDKSGMVKKAKSTGAIIYKYIAAPIAESKGTSEDLGGFKYQFGHRMHWSLGTEELGVLTDADDKMRNFCANCASKLFATHMICPGCETVVPIGKTVQAEDLMIERQKQRRCMACSEEGVFVPKVECEGCGVGVEGRLTSFDIRVQRRKPTETSYITEILAIRIPGVPGNPEDDARAKELIENPLDLSIIFTPPTLDRQKFICGKELTEGLRPDLAVRRDEQEDSNDETESYADSGSDRSIKFD